MARICIFCGALTGKDGIYVALAQHVARELVRAGHGIVYGGGRVGLMGALADAALAANGDVIGVIPRALAGVEVVHPSVTKMHVVESMHARKALMAELSDAFITLPGGFGTMDELSEMLTWKQLHIHDKPLGLLNHRGYYDTLLRLFDEMVERGFVTPVNRALLVARPTIEELLPLIA